MQIVGDRTLTSQAGSFTFSPNTRLSHAKLIRDTITASFVRAPSHRLPSSPARINPAKPQFASRWVRENMDGPIANEGIVVNWTPPGGHVVNHIIQLPNGRHVIS